MTRLAAGCGENALCHRHAPHIFRTGFTTHENDFFTALGPFFRLRRGKHHAACSGAGNSVDAGGEHFADKGAPVDLRVDDRVEQALNVFRLDA